ncbi:DNA polymerase III subunit delta' [Permianibacter sp. IMCC34836]|uniref:DNA polymerase III subunit delta' n=1 Tax=Permianibacter fluminis TaxID=2738515 RepID=UPI0015543BC3|nr:DNA polymerase III subunit delta' [Permianibacter fluminis]NQD38911.1 DNA polymerase III subunit delta' [Permianibacter fluminis]
MTDTGAAANALPVLPDWLTPVWKKLCWSLDANRVAHGLLLHGPRGIGKRWLAEHYAARLLCREARAEQPACGHCAGCALRLAGHHPDFLQLSIPEDKQSIGIEQVRELSGLLQQSAHRAGYRAVIIEPAEAMTLSAANALLKTLEEPGSSIVLILVAHQLERVPATIRSRCQRLPLAPPEPAAAMAWLQAQHPELAAERLQQALVLAAGAPLRVQGLLAQDALAQVDSLEKGLLAVARGELSPVQLAASQTDVTLALLHLQRVAARGLQKSLNGESKVPAILWDRFVSAVLEAMRAWRANPALHAQTLLESVLIQWFDFTAGMRHSKSATSTR